MWRRIEADGCFWEVRSLSRPDGSGPRGDVESAELLEFRAVGHPLPPRQLAVRAGALEGMDDAALIAAYRKALPVGGDHYGRPGKRMADAAGPKGRASG